MAIDNRFHYCYVYNWCRGYKSSKKEYNEEYRRDGWYFVSAARGS